MSAPTTTAEVVDLVYKSGLTDEARLRAFVGELTETESFPTHPAHFASELVRNGFLTSFQAEQLLLGKWKRFSIGTYTVLERLAAGTMGTVFMGEDAKLQRVVAIKVLAVERPDDRSKLERFFREARALAACDHHNVVRAYQVSQDESLYFIVMEYIDGTNLYTLVRKGPLAPVRAAHYIAQAANGLQHVHDLGLVHRNVKPTKLMLERNGLIKLCGLGIVLSRPDTQSIDEAVRRIGAAIRGTPNYIAPEQAIDSSSVDHRADVYSLGCTFYHLLTGQPPFPEGSVAQKMIWHQTRDPHSIRALQPAVPEEMARIVDRMMSKAPDSRYQSVAEMAMALSPWCGIVISPPTAEELPNHCPRVQEAIKRLSRTQSG